MEEGEISSATDVFITAVELDTLTEELMEIVTLLELDPRSH